MKVKFQTPPYQSLRRSLLWGEKARADLSLFGGNPGSSSKYILYESHVGEPLPLERICRGPDGRFVVQEEEGKPPREDLVAAIGRYSLSLASSDGDPGRPEPYLQLYSPARSEAPVWQKSIHLRPKNASQARREAKASGYCQGHYFDRSSSSPTEEAQPLCIVNISPVATMPYGATKQRAWASQGSEGCLEDPVAADSSSPGRSPSPSLSASCRPRSSQGQANASVQSGILQYLSLPFFKEMNVDGDEEEDEEEGGKEMYTPPFPEHKDGIPSPAYMDLQAVSDSAQEPTVAKSLLRLPQSDIGPAKAALPAASVGSGNLSSVSETFPGKEQDPRLQGLPAPQPLPGSSQAETAAPALPSEHDWLRAADLPPAEPLPPERHKVPSVALPAEKLLRGSLTSQSSGRGSVSWLRPPSVAPSLAGSYLSSPFGEVMGWQSNCIEEECKHPRDPSLPAISKR